MFHERYYAWKNDGEKAKWKTNIVSRMRSKTAGKKNIFEYSVTCHDDSNNTALVPLCRQCFQIIHKISKHDVDNISSLLKAAPSYSGSNINPAARKSTEAPPAGVSFQQVRDAITAVMTDSTHFVYIDPALVRIAMMPLDRSKMAAVCIIEQLVDTESDQSPENNEQFLSVSCLRSVVTELSLFVLLTVTEPSRL